MTYLSTQLNARSTVNPATDCAGGGGVHLWTHPRYKVYGIPLKYKASMMRLSLESQCLKTCEPETSSHRKLCLEMADYLKTCKKKFFFI